MTDFQKVSQWLKENCDVDVKLGQTTSYIGGSVRTIFIHHNYNLENKKLKIAYFTRTTSYNFSKHLDLINQLKLLKNVEIRLGNKPREIVPLKLSLFGRDDLNTTELILWSDIVISSATSILVESVQRKKLTICLEYLTPEKDNYASFFSDYEKIICIANSSEDVIGTINKFNSDNQFKIIDKIENSII